MYWSPQQRKIQVGTSQSKPVPSLTWAVGSDWHEHRHKKTPPHFWATAPNLGYRLPSAWELLPLMPGFKWLEVTSSRLFQTSRGFKCAAWVENHCSRIVLPHRVAICEYLKLETWTSNQIKNQFPDCTSHIQLLGAHGFSRWERTDLPCLRHHGWSCPGSSNESQEHF